MGAISKIIIVLLVLVGIGGVYVYTSLVQPLSKMQIQPGEIEPVTLEPLVLRLSLDVTNPGESVKLPGANLNLYLDGSRVGTGSLQNAVIKPGLNTLHSDITLDKGLEELLALAGAEPSLSIDGTLNFQVLSFSVRIPIPRLPVPGGIDLQALAGGGASEVMEILPLLRENPKLKIGEALDSKDFLDKFASRTGKELTQPKIQELKQILGENLNQTAEELLKDPSILKKLQQGSLS